MGYRIAELRRRMGAMRVHWFPRLRSTNDHAAELRRRGELYAPAVVLAGRQSAGRGRGSNTWLAPAGNLTMTVALPIDEHLSPLQIPLIAGLAVRNAAAALTGDDGFSLKWPNDVLYDGRKVAGLLCERVHKVDLIGVGMNVMLDPAELPAGLRGRVASLSMVSRGRLDSTEVAAVVAIAVRTLLGRRGEGPPAMLLNQYNRHHALVGRRVRIVDRADEPAVEGMCEGIDSIGRLLVREGGKLHRILAGHVEWG